MANELTITLKAVLNRSNSSQVTFPDADKQEISVTVTGTKFIMNQQSIGTSEEAIALGEVTTGGYFFAVNRDATNFISLRSGTGATNFAKLKPGECCGFRISSSASAPYAIADTGACLLEYFLLSD